MVPGCRVRPDGQPGQALRARLRQALWCWQAGLGKQLAVSGRGEASCGAAWLLQRGLPPPALVLEHRAQSTRENARFLAQLTGPLRLLVITQDFHATRCARFARHFEEVKVLLPSPWRARLPVELRRGPRDSETASRPLRWMR